MIWRQQHDDTDVSIARTLIVGDPNASGPPEQHDLSQYATSENHPAKVGAYRFTRRTLSTHTASVVIKPGNQTGAIAEGDIVQIYLQVTTSREPASVINRLYVVESKGHNLSGEETLSLSHFPVNSGRQSLIALAVAAAVGTGTILPSNRTGSSCDLPGAASDTSVPAKTTSGTPFSGASSGGGTDPYGGGGKPTDSPPLPGTDGAAQYAAGRGTLPPSPGGHPEGGDPRCPNGLHRVTGAINGGGVIFGVGVSATLYYIGMSLPMVTSGGSPYNNWSWTVYPWKVTWFGWLGAESGPPSSQSADINSLVALPGSPSGTPDFPLDWTAIFTCKLANGTPDAPTPARKIYTVVEGDSMRNISEKMYGTPNRADDIQNANPWLMGLDNWGLVPGTRLDIPV